MMSPLVMKLIGGLAAVLAIALLIYDRNNWKEKAGDRKANLEFICTTTRAAAANPKLDCKHVPRQISMLGTDVGELKRAIGDQNAAVAKLKATTADQQQRAAAAEKRATARARDADRTRAALEASARSGGAQRPPCAPSETVRESWQ